MAAPTASAGAALVAALIKAGHDEGGIVWPDEIAPSTSRCDNLKVGDAATDGACEQLYKGLAAKGYDMLYDDRDEQGGKFATADLIVLADHACAEGAGRGQGRAQAPRRRRARTGLARGGAGAVPRRQAWWWWTRLRRGESRPARSPSPASNGCWRMLARLRLGHRRFLSRHPARRRDADHGDVGDERFPHELLEKIVGVNGHIFATPIDRPLDDYDRSPQRSPGPGRQARDPAGRGAGARPPRTSSNNGVLVRGVREADIRSIPFIGGNIRPGTLDGFD